MNNLKTNLFNPCFSHIYIEKEVQDYPVAQKIKARFPNAVVIEIDHYKDVFCRSRQNYNMQKQAPGLILARKHHNQVYEGAPVCQNFGNRHFYYTSSVMNCIYDCEYCYLQGMYPSAHMVIFVNLEEIFGEVESILQKHPVYLCISYDTDLLAIEDILGYIKEWIGFAKGHPDVTIEIRTKSANWKVLEEMEPMENVILAWTLSPDQIARKFERHTPSFRQRLTCIDKAVSKGFQVRLCFDPMLYCVDWKNQYQEMITTIFATLSARQIRDVSIGVFRVSQDYMKRMRRQAPDSAVIQFPYENDKGVYHYGRKLTNEMVSFVYELVRQEISEDNIFLWDKVNQE